jgi:hypothetical protein
MNSKISIIMTFDIGFGVKKPKKKGKKRTTEAQRAQKRVKLMQNQQVGLGVQKLTEVKYAMAGFITTPKKTGYDFDADKGRKHYKVEVKANKNAKLRPLQKAMQKKKGRSYKVEKGFLD